MNRISCFLRLLLLALSSCGQTLDVGRDTPDARVVTRFEAFPDFTPTAIVSTGDALYVGGVSFPHREFDANAVDIGRIVRVPLDGSLPREVWKGPYFTGALVAYGKRVAFTETDPNNVLSPPTLTYGGIDVLDTETGQVTKVENAPGRGFVSTFAFGADGLVWAGSTLQVVTATSESGAGDYTSTLARWRGAGTSTIAVLPRSPASIFVRGDAMLADVLEDGSPSGFDDGAATSFQHAVFRVGESSLDRERVLAELPSVTPQSPDPNSLDWRAVAGDDARYYVTMRSQQGMFFGTLPREGSASAGFPTALTSLAMGNVQLDGARLFWTPADSPSMIRRRTIADEGTLGEEVYVDSGRQVMSLVAGEGKGEIYWLSTSRFDAREPYRIMAHGK